MADRDDPVELVAGPYDRAVELARAAGVEDTVAPERARFAFRDAGLRAFALGAFAAAVRFYRQALELWPDDNDRPSVLLELAESRYHAEEEGSEEAATAREAFLRLGNKEKAARAEAILSQSALAQGDGAAAATHAERALELAVDLPASRSKAGVFASAAWLYLHRGESQRALAHGDELRRMAEEIGSGEELPEALLLTGLARVDLGDVGGVSAMERALALARDTHSPWTPTIAGNLAVALFDLGRLERAFKLVADAHGEATQLGKRPTIAWLNVLRARERYWKGSWDDAVRLADEALAGISYEAAGFRWYTVRSQIRLARGRVQEAVEDTTKALAAGRVVKDPQALHTALAVHARACLAAGARAAALEAVDELLERFVAEGSQQLSASLPDLAVATVELNRVDAFRQTIAALKNQSPWIDAARAFVDGDFTAAAAIYAHIGSRPDAAYAQLRAAAALVEQGHRAEADETLSRALAFYRSVGATRYEREGEALLAATA